MINTFDGKFKNVLAPYPKRIYIDITNHCNLSCRLCPNNKPEYVTAKGFMKKELYKKILDKFAPHAQRLSLHNWGEPLLHPDLIEFIKYALTFDIDLKFSTNLTLLTPDLAEQLILSGLPGLTVSIHACSKENYKRYTTKDYFDRAIENLSMLVKIKKELNSLTPDITWLFVVNRYNEEEIESAYKLSKKIGVDYFVTIPVRTMMHEEIFLSNEQKIKKYGEWIPKNKIFDQYTQCKKFDVNKICYWPWERIVFDWRGGVYPCCLLYEDKYYITSLDEYPIDEIWNSKPFIEARKACFGEENSSICARCRKNRFQNYV